MLATCSMLSLHMPLGERLFRRRRFDLRGMKSILDVGSGAGQIAKHLLKYADPGAQVTCIDLSQRMLRRARSRLKSRRPSFVAADLSCLPFADDSFDGVTCGYVLEHLPDPRLGLAELARVMRRGGRMFLLTTEDNFSGAWTSRIWCCRTYNRQRADEAVRVARPALEERAVVYARAPGDPRRRHLRRDREGLTRRPGRGIPGGKTALHLRALTFSKCQPGVSRRHVWLA